MAVCALHQRSRSSMTKGLIFLQALRLFRLEAVLRMNKASITCPNIPIWRPSTSHNATAQSLEAVRTSSLSERLNSWMLLIVSVCGWNCLKRATRQKQSRILDLRHRPFLVSFLEVEVGSLLGQRVSFCSKPVVFHFYSTQRFGSYWNYCLP